MTSGSDSTVSRAELSNSKTAHPVGVKKPQRGELLTLDIESLAFGGSGVARHDGFVVFVSGAVPGDRVVAEVFKRKRRYAEARLTEVLKPSDLRIDPVADHPGVPWQVMPYEYQLEVKASQVRESIERLGKIEGFVLEDPVAAESMWRYRNKAEFSFGEDANGGLICGFHTAGRWDSIEQMRDCMIVSERSNELRSRVLAWCRDAGLGAYDRRTHEGFLRNLVIREGSVTGQLQVRVITSPGEFDVEGLAAAVSCDSFYWTQIDRTAEVTTGGETRLVAGAERIEDELCGLRFGISPESFFQTNTEMADVLYRVVGEYADLSGGESVLDLYCGSGTIGLTLAGKASSVHGFEVVPEAVRDAEFNAKLNGVLNARFTAADVKAFRESVEADFECDLAVLDPPRSGLSKKALKRVAQTQPKKIVYVSCNPSTFAPNVAQLAEYGYSLKRVRPVDMFPQTPHIECVGELVLE